MLFSPIEPEPTKNQVKYSTVKCKHFSAVLVYFAKIFREISSVEKYNEFKGVTPLPMLLFYSILFYSILFDESKDEGAVEL